MIINLHLSEFVQVRRSRSSPDRNGCRAHHKRPSIRLRPGVCLVVLPAFLYHALEYGDDQRNDLVLEFINASHIVVRMFSGLYTNSTRANPSAFRKASRLARPRSLPFSMMPFSMALRRMASLPLFFKAVTASKLHSPSSRNT